MIKPVVRGGAGGAMAPTDFSRSVNPISTKEVCNRGVACSLLKLDGS